MTINVEFEPVGRRGECPDGHSLLDCARQLGVDLVSLCGGAGTCGRCKVQVLDGQVSDVTSREQASLTPDVLAEGYRLACQAIPLGNCKIGVPPASLTTPQRTQVEGQESAVDLEPPVHVYSVLLSPPSLEEGDLQADAERLLDALRQQHQIACRDIDIEVLRNLSSQVREANWQTDVVLRDDNREIVALLSPSRRPLGLAVDLGTTKIAGYLVDLENGRTLATQGMMNPQIAYGEDLIARMGYAKKGLVEATELQQKVVGALNQMATTMCGKVDANPAEIVEAVVVGNTAMHHLFLRLPVAQLARAPYVPAVDAALDVKAHDVGLNIAPGAYMHLLPNIAGYVGADHVAMLLATGVAQAEGTVLALDIGTNTEICLIDHGAMTSLSCASGPAFEGAHIKHGMRAAKGAIERMQIVGDQLAYQTIGGVAPVGLCGSGVLDGDEGMREFVLVSEEEREGQAAITLTQKDIQELQLAKGAIRAGIQILLETRGLAEQTIDRVIIAGAFGTYIDVSSAMAIGMLPTLPLERFEQVGNAAGIGAKLALISRSKRAEAQDIARRVDYIELATIPHFRRTFARAMYLG
ncbi:MAG: ASKHA domain-containing protein [Anaerolineae bacterium]